MASKLKCPHCGHSVVLQELLEERFGYWLLTEEPAGEQGRPSAVSSGTALADSGMEYGPTALESDAGDELGSNEADSPQDEFQLQHEDRSRPKAASPRVQVQPITHEQFERIKRKKRSPLWGILQVALGGLAAIPIALLLLWYLFDKDIAGAGPRVAQYLPWIVPEKFHPAKSLEQEETGGRRLSRGDSGFRQFDDVLPMDALKPSTSSSPDQGSELVLAELEKSREPAASGEESSPGLEQMPESEATDDQAAVPTPDTRNILLLVERCQQDLDAWQLASQPGDDEADVNQLRSLAQQLYADLVALTAVVYELPQGTPVLRAIRDALQPLGRSLKRQPKAQQVVEQGARHWMQKYSGQTELPLAAIVEIASVTEDDAGWRIEAQSSASLASIDGIFVPRQLAPSLIPGQRLLLLGMLHSSPDSSDESAAVDDPPSELQFEACYLHGL